MSENARSQFLTSGAASGTSALAPWAHGLPGHRHGLLGARTEVPDLHRGQERGANSEAAPKWSIISFESPARGALPPVTFTWYDGRKFSAQELVEKYGKYGITKTVEIKVKNEKTGKEEKKHETVPANDDNGSLLIGEKRSGTSPPPPVSHPSSYPTRALSPAEG